jgi:hypothetical protein
MPLRTFPAYPLPAWFPSVAAGTGSPNEELPAYGLVCDNCAYIQFFSAIALGLPHESSGGPPWIPPEPPPLR